MSRRKQAEPGLLEIKAEPELQATQQAEFVEPPHEALEPIRNNNDPSQLLAMAVQKDLDIDKLQRLVEMQERWEARQAERAFNEALMQFQAIVPRISKKKMVKFTTDRGTTEYYYAPLGDIEEIIKPAMLECGLSKKWDIEDQEDKIVVTCIILHKMGHRERGTPMNALADDSGKKNRIQSRGSTVTYLQRYTLIGALGIATADDDIDARLESGNEKITVAQASHIKESIEETKGDLAKFLAYMKAEKIEDIPLKDYGKAMKAIEVKAAAQGK